MNNHIAMTITADIAIAKASEHVAETVQAGTAFDDGINTIYGLSTAGRTAGKQFDYVIKFGTADPDLVRVEPHIISRLDEAAVPVPSVYGTGEFDGVPYFVASYLSGEQPAHAVDLDRKRVQQLARKMGAVLGQIHRVSIGVGRLFVDETGTLSATDDHWDAVYQTFLETFAQEAKSNYPHLGSEALRLAHWVDTPAIPDSAVLCPIDFHTHNLFVSDSEIQGVIDFERCYGGHPGWAYAISEHFLIATRADARQRISEAFAQGYEHHQSVAPAPSPAFELGAVLREMRAAHILWDEPDTQKDRIQQQLHRIEAQL